MRLLIVDDNQEYSQVLRDSLPKNWEVDCYATFADAENRTSYIHYDVACLDVHLDEGHMLGIELCRNLKKKYPDIKIIMFTGFETKPELVTKMIEGGADSFLSKNSAATFMTAKIQMLIETFSQKASIMKEQSWEILPTKRSIILDLGKITLSPTLFTLCSFFLEHLDESLHVEELERAISSKSDKNHFPVKMHISLLRKKIRPYGFEIQNQWGGWYSMNSLKP